MTEYDTTQRPLRMNYVSIDPKTGALTTMIDGQAVYLGPPARPNPQHGSVGTTDHCMMDWRLELFPSPHIILSRGDVRIRCEFGETVEAWGATLSPRLDDYGRVEFFEVVP
jgi:hypothetical protein